MSKILVSFVLSLVCAGAFGSVSVPLDRAPINPSDIKSLQSGAQIFVNQCLACHGASVVRYNQLTKIGLTEAQIKDNLLFTAEKVGEMMKTAASPADQKAWFGAQPPDLSVIARSRGVDWLYNYMLGFYRDPSRPTGWNNTVFPNVGMPHVLWHMQGTREAEHKMVSDGHGGQKHEIVLGAATGGSQSAVEYQKTVVDLVNFLGWMGEPGQLERKRLGYFVLIALGVLMLLTYLLKIAFWKDVH